MKTETMTPKVQRAWVLSQEIHDGQMYGVFPYVKHIWDVYSMGAEHWPDDEDVLVALLLHDGPEDTSLTVGDIRTEFGDRPANMVHAVTTPSSLGNRNIRLEVLFEQLLEFPEGLKVKLPDRKANVTSCWTEHNPMLFRYYKEHRKLRKRLRPLSLEDPKLMALWADIDKMLGWWDPDRPDKR